MENRQASERGKKKVVPGGHGCGVERDRPAGSHRHSPRRGERWDKAERNRVKTGQPTNKKEVQDEPQGKQPHTENCEGGRMEVVQQAAVDLVEVAMRQLAVQHAFSTLRESAVVMCDPPAPQPPSRVHQADGEQDEEPKMTTQKTDQWR